MIIDKIAARLRNWVVGFEYNCKIPERIIILLTNPRSGSTWLFDALRCHPAIYMHPCALIYRLLALDIGKRRYPRDLSNGPDGIQTVEVLPGHWERIPHFSVEDTLCQSLNRPSDDKYAIEKFHPHFFNYNVCGFLDKVKKIEDKGIRIKFIYQVRDPKAAMSSFMNYQSRNPSWLRKESAQPAAFMSRTYDAIISVAQQRQGLIIDYSNIVTDLASTLLQVYRYLWSDSTPREIRVMEKISQAAAQATSRNKRAASGTVFFGKQTGPVRGHSANYKDFFDEHSDMITECYRSYKLLLGLAEGNQLEPDLRYGKSYLEVIKDEVIRKVD